MVKKNEYYPVKIILSIPKDKARNARGEARLKMIKLSKSETKEIMIRELVIRRKFIWLVRMYPEERRNLDSLKDLYLESPNGEADPNLNVPPPNNVPDLNNN